MTLLKNLFIFFLLGIIYGWGFPNPYTASLFYPTSISLSGYFFLILRETSYKKNIYFTLSYLCGINLMAFYWIAGTLESFGGIPYILGLLLNFCFSLIVAPYFYFFAIVLTYFNQPNRMIFFQKKYSIFFLSALFVFAEYFIPYQFPTQIGHSWMFFEGQLPLAQFGGVPLYSFISIFFCLIFAFYFKQIEFKKNIIFIPVFLTGLNFFLDHQMPMPTNKKLNTRIVQANIGNFMKLESELGNTSVVDDILKAYYVLSTQKSEQKLDLIIWPETAYPFSFQSPLIKQNLQGLPQIFNDIMNSMNAEMIIGGYDRPDIDAPNWDYYMTEFNSVLHFSQKIKLKDVYHKHILLPFGETLPFGPFNKFLSKYLDSVSFFGEGKKFTEFKMRNGARIISPICYEILNPTFMRKYLNAQKILPHFILNLTNDSWYGDTSEPKLHLFVAKWRALEFQIPIIRSTNTGISSVIFPDGSESPRLEVGESKVLDLALNIYKTKPTIYLKYGIFINLLFWLVLFLAYYLIDIISMKRSYLLALIQRKS